MANVSPLRREDADRARANAKLAAKGQKRSFLTPSKTYDTTPNICECDRPLPDAYCCVKCGKSMKPGAERG